MNSSLLRALALPLLPFTLLTALWFLASGKGWLPESFFPSPQTFSAALWEHLRSGDLARDLAATLFRVLCGYGVSVAAGLGVGLWLGLKATVRLALLPLINFLRALSPLTWIPFTIYWIGAGHGSVIFLIFLAVFPPVALSTVAAIASIPSVYFRVARDYGLKGATLLRRVIFPAILPQTITTLRVSMGMSWLVMVAGEMLAGKGGLGFLIQDANSNLRSDLILVGMVWIGVLGIVSDRLVAQLARVPSVRWGYER